MWLKKKLKVALLGNPNAGKSSLFNQLTGLNQKVGNFPGVTIDKKTGLCQINKTVEAEIIDLPGIYSLYPKSLDEKIVFDILMDQDDSNHPDIIVVTVDASNLRRNLLLFTQIRDLGFPIILALNMVDVAAKEGIDINEELLSKELGVPVVSINGRTGKGLDKLKSSIICPVQSPAASFISSKSLAPHVVSEIQSKFSIDNSYKALQIAHQYNTVKMLTAEGREVITDICERNHFDSDLLQSEETIFRYDLINTIFQKAVTVKQNEAYENFSSKLDRILTHKVFGFFLFFFLLFLIFQGLFFLAEYPMEWIEAGVEVINTFLSANLPPGPLTQLLTDGFVAGLSGIIIFIPQISILFLFISILEESGYMSRVMFIMDRIMRQFGMNGKSVVPLVSGVACAVPAIMATRSIDNRKERLVTILVTPLMSCSARIPVYTILIGLIVPATYVWGIFNLQGLMLMGLYLLGFVAAIFSGWVANLFLKNKDSGYFIMEFPDYRIPKWSNVGITIIEKVKAFVFGAGKIIIAISIILCVLSIFGPSGQMEKAEKEVELISKQNHMSADETDNLLASKRLENSYAGHFGKVIEPVIRPLGFDWKIGIALISSFAAREVFISTMNTIYSIGQSGDEESTIKQRMLMEKDPITGKQLYTPALVVSLLLFYVFAMQCMSTLAIVQRETKSWKWPAFQFVYMTLLAYISSYLAFQWLS